MKKARFGLQLAANGAPAALPNGAFVSLSELMGNRILNSEGKDKEKSCTRFALAMKLGALKVNEEVELSKEEVTIIEEVIKEGGMSVAAAAQIHKALDDAKELDGTVEAKIENK